VVQHTKRNHRPETPSLKGRLRNIRLDEIQIGESLLLPSDVSDCVGKIDPNKALMWMAPSKVSNQLTGAAAGVEKPVTRGPIRSIGESISQLLLQIVGALFVAEAINLVRVLEATAQPETPLTRERLLHLFGVPLQQQPGNALINRKDAITLCTAQSARFYVVRGTLGTGFESETRISTARARQDGEKIFMQALAERD
jgi:hypothetical protein